MKLRLIFSLVTTMIYSTLAMNIPEVSPGYFVFDDPNISTPEQHLGPVAVNSLNLVQVFNCLRNYSNVTNNIGYKLGYVGVVVNISIGHIMSLSDEVLHTCFSDNEHGLHQLAYLSFTQGSTDRFDDLANATSDNTVVYSNIQDPNTDAFATMDEGRLALLTL